MERAVSGDSQQARLGLQREQYDVVNPERPKVPKQGHHTSWRNQGTHQFSHIKFHFRF